MVQTRTRDHGVADKAPRKALTKNPAKDRKPKSSSGQVTNKRARSVEEPNVNGASAHEQHDTETPPAKKAKHEITDSGAPAQEPANESQKAPAVDVVKVHDILSKYGTLPLSDIGLKEANEATPETILAFVFHAMLTSARISHELAYKSVKCLIEAGYQDVHELKKSSWQERTEVLTKGGYTRYREKTATALGELADFTLEQYGMGE